MIKNYPTKMWVYVSVTDQITSEPHNYSGSFMNFLQLITCLYLFLYFTAVRSVARNL